MTENSNLFFYVLIGITAAFILIFIVYNFSLFLNDFSSELKYLNSEISRTEGLEREHWIRTRRRLWLSLLPFIKY